MSFMHSKSTKLNNPKLELFDVPPTQTSIISSDWEELHPKNPINERVPIQFTISKSGNFMIDPEYFILYLLCRLVNQDGSEIKKIKKKDADGKDIEVYPDVGLVNNFMHSLFSQIIVECNNVRISSNISNYALNVYLQMLLGFGPAAKKSHLESVLFKKDDPDKFHDRVNNRGFTWRTSHALGSNEFEMQGPLFLDISTTDRYLPNNLEIEVKMVRSDPEYYLQAEENKYKIEILKSKLWVRRLEICPSIMCGITDKLKTDQAKFPFIRTEVNSFQISKGLRSVVHSNLILGVQPNLMLFGVMPNSAFIGNIEKSPFEFGSYNISRITLYSNGKVYPGIPFDTNFKNKSLNITSYLSLFQASGINHGDDGNDLTREDYHGGSALWAFILTQDGNCSGGMYWNTVRIGSSWIEIIFSKPTPDSLVGVYATQTDALMQIDGKYVTTVST